MDLALFSQRGFSAGLLVSLIFSAGITSSAFVLMVFLQSGFAYTPLRAGLSIVPLAIGLMVGSGASIDLSKRIGRSVLQFGCLTALGGALWLALVVGGHRNAISAWDTAPCLALLGLGIGLVIAPLADFVLAGAPARSAGSASGLQATMIQVGSAVGVAILGVIFFGLIADGADGAFARVAPQLERDLVVLGVPVDSVDRLVTDAGACFHDRTRATDPTAAPRSCETLSETQRGVLKTAGPVVARAATSAGRSDFSGSLQRTLYYHVGIFAMTGLLVLLMPASTRQEAPASPGPTQEGATGMTPSTRW